MSRWGGVGSILAGLGPVAIAVTLGGQACKTVGVEAQLVRASERAAACLRLVRQGYPESWSIERVLDQRVLKDGWSRVPEYDELRGELTAVVRLLSAGHPMEDYEFPKQIFLSEQTGDLATAGKVFRRVDSLLTDLRVEHGMQPLPLMVDGEPIPPLPKPVQLHRWPSEAEDYRTLTWPLESGVVLVEIVRQLPGHGDCPARLAPGVQCHRYAVTRVGWDGIIEPRVELTAPGGGAYWLRWDVASDGRLYALGVTSGEPGSGPVLGDFEPRSVVPIITPLSGDVAEAERVEAVADGVLVYVGEVSYFAPQENGPLTFAKGSRPTLGRQTASAAPMTLAFADGSKLRIEQRRRVLLASRESPEGEPSEVARLADLYGELGHLNYVVADRNGWVAAAFTHPSARATSLLLSPDGGRAWGPAPMPKAD